MSRFVALGNIFPRASSWGKKKKPNPNPNRLFPTGRGGFSRGGLEGTFRVVFGVKTA